MDAAQSNLSNLKEFSENLILNREGEWFHDGQLITHERTIALLFKSLYRNGKGYFLKGERVPIPVVVEGTPFFIEKMQKKKSRFSIFLSDGSEEVLNPSTIYFTEEGSPNCLVKEGTMSARLTRKVYYQLTKSLVEKQGYLGLQVENLFYPLEIYDHSRKK